MRIDRRLLIVLVLVAAFGGAKPAKAAPVAGLVAAIGSWVSGVVAAGGAALFGLQLAVGLGLQLVASAFLRPSTPDMKPSDRMINTAQPVTYQTRLYGRARIGGAMGLDVQRDGRRHRVILIAAHSTRGPHIHWLDNWEVELLEEGNPDNPPISGGLIPGIPGVSPPWGSVITRPIGAYDGEDDLPVPTFRESYGCIRTYTGKPDQEADAILVDAIEEWTTAHDLAGISYGAIWAKKANASEAYPKVYPIDGMWDYAPVWDGHDQIWDPRDETYKWTRNAALIIAHELTAYQGHSVDWDHVAAEADVCDESVTNGDGGTQPRWQIDVVVSDDQPFTDILATMMTACDGFLFERPDGSTGFNVGRWIEPTVTLTGRDFLVLEIADGAPFGAPNEFTVQYSEPAADWKESPTGVWIHDPDGNRLRDEIAVYSCGSHNQASRLNKRRARKTHARYRITGTIGMIGYDLVGQRFVRLQHAELGIDIAIEIERLLRNADLISFEIEAVSVAEEDFAFVAGEEEPARPIYDRLEGDNTIAPPDGLAATVVSTGRGAASVLWSWPEQDRALRQQLRYRATDAGLPDWITVEVPSVDASGSVTPYTLTTGMIDGATYEGQVRNLDNQAGASTWSPATPLSVVAVADTTPPGALVSFTATAGAAEAVIAFEAPNDGQYYATRIYRADDSTDYDDAVLVRTEYGIPSNSDSWTDTGLAAGDYSYWGRPINSSGIPGPFTTRRDVTIL